MMNEENKVIEAVKIIQQYCDRKKHCSDCIFGEEKHITDCIFGEENHITVQIQCGLSNRFPYDWDPLKEVNTDANEVEVLEKMIDAIDFAIKATDLQDDYSMGMRNGMRYVKSLIDNKEPQYELRRTDEEIKLGIDFGDEVIDDYGVKGVVVGIYYKGEVWLSILMRNHKVPQLVKASRYKKTGRHFPQIIEVLEKIKGEADGK